MPHRSGTLLWPSQTERLEAVQRRAINIIFCYSSTPYLSTLALADISSLQARRVDLCKRFSETFVDLTFVYTTFSYPSRPSSDIPAQEAYCISKPSRRTKRYCSTVSYALLHFRSNQSWVYFVFCMCFRLYHVLLYFIMYIVLCCLNTV